MLSVTVLTKNCATTLKATLESVRSFQEVVVLDTGSTDGTLEIAQAFPNVKLFSKPFQGFGPTHNEASALASNDWIFSLDSDEIMTPELVAEVQSLILNPKNVYQVRRDNYFNGKHIRCCSGWYPDIVPRLYHRSATRFSDASVHERVLSDGLTTVSLRHPVLHTPYRGISDFLTKMQTYSSLFAEQNRRQKKSSLAHAMAHGTYAFFKSYLLKRGILGGKEGFIISLYIGQTAFYKYLKLAELNKETYVK